MLYIDKVLEYLCNGIYVSSIVFRNLQSFSLLWHSIWMNWHLRYAWIRDSNEIVCGRYKCCYSFSKMYAANAIVHIRNWSIIIDCYYDMVVLFRSNKCSSIYCCGFGETNLRSRNSFNLNQIFLRINLTKYLKLALLAHQLAFHLLLIGLNRPLPLQSIDAEFFLLRLCVWF